VHCGFDVISVHLTLITPPAHLNDNESKHLNTEDISHRFASTAAGRSQRGAAESEGGKCTEIKTAWTPRSGQPIIGIAFRIALLGRWRMYLCHEVLRGKYYLHGTSLPGTNLPPCFTSQKYVSTKI
jgi:hypothetical protein